MGPGNAGTSHQILKHAKKTVKASSPWIALHMTSHVMNDLITCSLSYIPSSNDFENMSYFVIHAFSVLRSCCPKPGHQASFCRREAKNGLWYKEFKIWSFFFFFCNALQPRLSPFCVDSGVLPVMSSE